MKNKNQEEEFRLIDKVNKDINLLEKNDDLIKVKFVQKFIRLLKKKNKLNLYGFALRNANENIDKLWRGKK